jgi:hypothetical protein
VEKPDIEEMQINFRQDQEDGEDFNFKIKFISSGKLSSSSSREASIVSSRRKITEDLVEESMTITVDSFQISAKRTTTPKRLLQSFSRSKRSANTGKGQPMAQSDARSEKSESELSDGFNLTTNSVNAKDETQKRKHNRRLSNSCGTNGNKRKDFIKAVLDQQKSSTHIQMGTSKISENEINLMMSSSSGTAEKVTLQPMPVIQSQKLLCPKTLNQTEDNYDYTISPSPQSKNSSDIKRRINFDDASGENRS